MVKNFLRALRLPVPVEEGPVPAPEAERAAVLVQASGETIVVLDGGDRVIAASPKALARFEELAIGEPAPYEVLDATNRMEYEAGGRVETLIRLPEAELSAYEELRSGFTAVVSHELRTPLARLLALLESALLPGADQSELIGRARGEVERIGELIDDVLFLSELESGRAVVALGSIRALPAIERVAADVADRAAAAGVELRIECTASFELPLRARMLQVVVENLVLNAIRHAGPDTTCTISCTETDSERRLVVADNGVGVADEDLARLFERFYRADRARSTRGSGLGLAIVKHVVVAAAGTVEASVTPGGGLTITCIFPARL
jgi:two-component system, OmpR family, phosphate regulon sensor histidine kinase PhoR